MSELKEAAANYKKYKWFFTSSGKLVIGGRNSEQNDSLLSYLISQKKEYLVMHTTDPGSPFAVIISPIERISSQEIKECAIFTASFSQAWKKGKLKASLDIFKSSQLYKEKGMKIGTWGVIGKIKRTIVNLELALTTQKGTLRAVPLSAVKNKKNLLSTIVPGKIPKETFVCQISATFKRPFNKEELLSALPSGGFKTK